MIYTRYRSRWSVSVVLRQKVLNNPGFAFRVYRWATGKVKARFWRRLNGAKGERVRCTVYWLSHRAPLCPRWAAIVLADKALIQHIFSPRESSGNRRRWPSPTPPPPSLLILFYYLSLRLSVSAAFLHGNIAISKGVTEQCKGTVRNLKNCYFFFFLD